MSPTQLDFVAGHSGGAVPADPRDASRFLQSYAKGYSAGAFAAPTGKELEADPQRVREWRSGGDRVVAVVAQISRLSKRTDFTGTPFLLPPGATVITHLARSPQASLPDLTAFDYVFAYREDPVVSSALIAQGRTEVAVKVSSAAEIITCWGKGDHRRYGAHDLATITRMPIEVSHRGTQDAIAKEVAAVHQWHDDFPYYSDGSWSAVSLRGFRRDDPTWGIKPSEMPRSWKAEHPEAMGYRCEWTVLADHTPKIVELVESVPWWRRLERVRLLQMSGRGGKGGKLGRHSDISDRAQGTADGEVVRFHIPIVTHPDIKMHAWALDGSEMSRHLEQWGCYYLDARKPHAVVNPTPVDRVHLVVDVLSNAEVREQIAAAYGHRLPAAS